MTWLTTNEAAELADVDPRTVIAWCAKTVNGDFDRIRLNNKKHIGIDEESFLLWLATRKDGRKRNQSPPGFISLATAAKLADVHPQTVQAWIQGGARFTKRTRKKSWWIGKKSFLIWLENDRATFTNPKKSFARNTVDVRGKIPPAKNKPLAAMTQYYYIPRGGEGVVMERGTA